MPRLPWPIARDRLELDRRRAGPAPRRRSVLAAGLMIAGFALAAFGAPRVPSTPWFSLAAAALATGLVLRGAPRRSGTLGPRLWRLGAAVALVLGSAGWYAVRVHERAAGSVAWDVDAEAAPGPVLAALHGVVRDPPLPVEGGRGALGAFARAEPGAGFTLSLTGVESEAGAVRPASGDVRVRVGLASGPLPAWVRPGAGLRVEGRLRSAPPPMNPGEPDWRALAAQEGRVGDLDAESAALLAPAPIEGLWDRACARWWSVAGVLRARCAAALDAALPAEDAALRDDAPPAPRPARALLGALVLGDRDPGDSVSRAFGRLGLVHLVAISGFNLAVMAAVAMALLRATGDRGWLEPACVALLVALYLLVLPAQASIVRAGVLVLALLAADALGRRYDRATLTGWTACAALLVRPLDAWSLGFQLSFGVVLALITLGDVAHARLWGVPLRGLAPTYVPPRRLAPLARLGRLASRVPDLFRQQVTASLLAWGVSTPLIAMHTGAVSPLAPLATLVVLPLTSLVLWAGYVVLLAGVLAPPRAGAAGWALDGLGTLLSRVVLALDAHAGLLLHLPRLSPAWALCATAWAVWLVLHKGERSWRGRVVWPAALVLTAWLGAETLLAPGLRARAALRIDTLAVGDGSCHLLRAGGEALLWDCGSLRTGVGERLVPEAVRALGAWRVPTVVVTHAHIDHFAGLPDVVEPLGVRLVLAPPQLLRAAERSPRGAAAALLRELSRRGVRVAPLAEGGALTLGPVAGEVRWPPPDRDFRDPNDTSIVAMLRVPLGAEGAGGERRVLMTGDAAREALAGLVPVEPTPADAARWRADVLELPHHGGFIEPAAALVGLASPAVVLQSTGPRRAADPRWAPLMSGRVRHVTATTGAAWVEIAPDGTITTGRFR